MKTMRSYLNEYLRADWDMITGMDISIIRACAEKTNKKKERIEFSGKDDVMPFIKDQNTLNIWSTEYFLQLADMVKLS